MVGDRKILILGDGRLSTEIRKQVNWSYISRKQGGFDFNKTNWYWKLRDYKVIVNCIANTDTYSKDREDHWKTNYTSLMNLVDECNETNRKIVHISTDYIYSGSKENASENDIPITNRTWYTHTKMLGDAYVQARANKYLLIRTSFKPTPWPYPNAITTQTGNFDYVDVIAGLIIRLIKEEAEGIYNVGTETKTIYDLAIQTKPNVIKSTGVLNKYMPTNTTMDLTKLKEFMNEG